MKNNPDPRVKTSLFPLQGFIFSFIALAALTTGQMLILRNHIDISSLPTTTIIAVVVYWVLIAAAFIAFTRRQFYRDFQKPMEEFAQATRKVAGGDFSVYVPPRHLPDKLDYIDVIFTDFNTMVEELGSMETLKIDFFSNVSHEIKTPLATIKGYAQGLKGGNLAEAQKDIYVDTIIESSTRLSDLISNILKLNKLEKQKLQPVSEPYDICAQLCECALRFEDMWANKDIEFEADIEDRAMIEADSGLFEVVWNNLISNAVKFTETGGTVTLRQTSTDSEIIVSVSDTGCGMDDETLKHIFDKFYQGDASHSTEGNGLGLALVLRILQLTESSISVYSSAGEGTTFTVRIPVNRAQNN
jgi:Signal transduction histidine kinase